MTLPTDDPQWYKDAVIYELHVRSFLDSNGDGMGDFEGLTEKLDYLQDLGVSAIWLLPFYPSPWKDDGYDISDYSGIHQAYGTLRDFKRLLKEAHKRDLKVITELVINHTSNQHPWFDRARRARPGTKYRDFYVWSDTPERYDEARIIFQDFENSNWTWDAEAKAYYWHRFYSHQPDLNFDNPEVQNAVLKVLDFWFGMGVDGLRLDAVPYLYERENTNCENLPETHEFLKKLRRHVDESHTGKMLLAEANQWPEDAVEYFGNDDECHMCFHFPLMPRLFMSVKMEDRFPVTDILDQTPELPEKSQWGIFLRNHDELTLEMVTDEERDYMYRVYARDPNQRINLGIRRRLAPLLENNRRQIELLNILLFSLPGTPVIYYGDEIGMGDNVYLGDRDGVRTPMQWSSDKNAGFSTANPQRLYLPVIIDPEYHYEAINIETQQANSSSLLWWMKRVIATRRRYKAFSRGSIEFVSSNNTHVFAFVRRYEEETILVIVNFSRHTQVAELDLEPYAGYVPEEVFSRNEFPRVKEEDYTIYIGGNDYYWFTLRAPEPYADPESRSRLPELAVSSRDWAGFTETLKEGLEGWVLERYLTSARWYREKTRKIRSIEVADRIPIGTGDRKTWLITVSLDFTDDKTETYVMPLATALREEAEAVQAETPVAVVARLQVSDVEGVLYDAVYSSDFREEIMRLLLTKKKLKGAAGEVRVTRGRRLRQLSRDLEAPYASRVLKVEQSNTSLLYRETFFFKLYRKLEDGLNPDVELLRHLTERSRFENVPPFAASLEYVGDGFESASLGELMGFVPNEGDGLAYAGSSVDRYFDSLLANKQEEPAKPPLAGELLDISLSTLPEEVYSYVDGFFLEMMDLLGVRTGQLHLALAVRTGDKSFDPEPFSKLYQRSVYQSLRSLFRRVMTTVRRVGKQSRQSDPTVSEYADLLASREGEIMAHFASITGRKIHAEKTRIHGDYHLQQVLFTGRDFVVIDLEGEPARTLGERRLKYCPLRDIAGMMRSFHYAVYGRYLQYAEVRPEDADYLSAWIDPWYRMVSGIFVNAYRRTVGDADFIPSDPEELRLLLDVFLLEKAVYEVGYEINNRPDRLRIPVDGIQFILERTGN
ncbi:MAG: maltose alpha-D-glucosyltransferase [Spirochaetaceae bacterium]